MNRRSVRRAVIVYESMPVHVEKTTLPRIRSMDKARRIVENFVRDTTT
jgi:hypothetical protein